MTINSPTILIAATARNVGRHVGTFELLMSALEKHFNLAGVCVVESDSDDGTVEQFNALASRKSCLKFTSLGRLRDTIPDRIDRIAHCRAVAQDSIRSLIASKDRMADSFVLVLDLDGVASPSFVKNAGVHLRNAIAELDGQSWYALSGITRPFYYDILALRCDGWVDEDYRDTLARLTAAGVSDRISKRIAVGAKQIAIRQSEPPFRVQSAFNGLVLYKADVFLKGCYALPGGGGSVCEHVVFHQSINSVQDKHFMYLVPSLVVGKSPAEHLLRVDWSAMFYGLKHRLFKPWM